MTIWGLLGWGAAVVLGYAVLSRGLFLATDSARQSLIGLAGDLIAHRALPEDEKDEIRDSLDTAYSALSAWVLVLCAIVTLVRLPFAGAEMQHPAPPMLRDTYDKFVGRWVVATMGNSLLAAILFAVVYLVAAALHVSIYMLARSVMPLRRHHRRSDHAPA